MKSINYSCASYNTLCRYANCQVLHSAVITVNILLYT